MHFCPALPADAAVVARILSLAAERLRERGQALWSAAEVGEPAVAAHVQAGRYHLGLEAGEPVGVFRLDPDDPVFWPEMRHRDAAYLHKLALHPAWQGRGGSHQLLAHAVTLTRQRGLRYLRLDCLDGRPGLRLVYEGFGFRRHDAKVLGASTFERFELDVDTWQASGGERPEVAVRAPQPADTAAVHALLCAHGWGHRIRDVAWLQELLHRSRAVVAVDGSRVVGFARGVTDGLSNGYLSMVVVAESHRGRGIGARLVREVMGPDGAITWVLRAQRPGTQAFFARLGFRASTCAMERTREDPR